MTDKYHFVSEEAFKIFKKDKIKESPYYVYDFNNGPTKYPCVAIVSSYSVPDTYLTECEVDYVYLSDFQ